MKTEDLLRNQLSARLRRLRERVRALNAEIQLVEGLLANSETGAFKASLKLRKNAVRKLTVRAQVRNFLAERDTAVKAQHIYDALRQTDPSLKSTTFRSDIKRMVDAGIIKQEGARGYYRLAEKPDTGPKERESFRPRKIRIPYAKFY